jgi:hypothetical protein
MSYVTAQDVVAGFGMGIGYYGMEELKSFNETVSTHIPFETNLIDDFPPYYYYHPSIAVYLKRIEVGFAWYFHSSGSRYSSQDYSGEYLFDSKVKSSGPSAMFNYCFNPSNKLRFLISNEMGILGSKLTIDESLFVGEHKVVEETVLFKSRNLFWEPGIKLEYPIWFFIMEGHAGYFIQSQGKGFYSTQNGGKIFLENHGSEVHPGWNGVRIGLSVLFNFSK